MRENITMHFVQAKGILSQNNGMNIYRGCSHGCIYCDSRSRCYGFTHAFEDIEVKKNAPELLEQALRSKRHKCMIGTGAMCDPYLPAEKELQLTRKCLELIDRYEYGVTVLTKSNLVLRDLDLLQSINKKAKAVVQMTLTTYDEELCRKIEPHVSTTRERFEVLMRCKELGIPTLVWMTPILPFINDTRENIEDLYGCSERELFLAVLDELSQETGNRGSFQVIEEKIASMSCKAAVKGNNRLSLQEAEQLIDELLTLDNPYNCPHGRPTIITMTETDLEKKFKRIV